jgi:hypothetical protein
MPTLTTKDSVEIFYKDWGEGQPIVFSHGWPLSADDWDAQMLFFLKHGYRVIDTPRATASPASAIPDSSRWVRSWSTRPSSINRKLWDRRSISLTPGLYLDRDRIIHFMHQARRATVSWQLTGLLNWSWAPNACTQLSYIISGCSVSGTGFD